MSDNEQTGTDVNEMLQRILKEVRRQPEDVAKALAENDTFVQNLANLLIKSGVISHQTALGTVEAPPAGNDDAASAQVETPVPQNVDSQQEQVEERQKYYVQGVGPGVPAAHAAMRCDSSHELFPNQLVVFTLMEKVDTKLTFWQITPFVDREVLEVILAAFVNEPANTIRRFNLLMAVDEPTVVDSGDRT